MKDFVIYTAITNGYDVLKATPESWRGMADFVAFLDEPQAARGWEVRPINRRFRDPCRNAKTHKVMPHKYFKRAKYSLWIDGSIRIVSRLPLAEWPQRYLRDCDLAVFKHPRLDCAYKEGATCMRLGLDATDRIDRQMQKYFDEGYPHDNGLAECTVIFRRHTVRCNRFNEAWYAEIKAHSRRDQLSFNYVAHKLNFKFSHMPGFVSHNEHFKIFPHAAPRSVPT
jgi:hypothetical protein